MELFARRGRQLAAVQSDHLEHDEPMTVRTYLEEWLWGKQSLSPSTHLSYETHVRRYLTPYLGNLRMDVLRPIHVERMYRELAVADHRSGRPLSVATLRRIHGTLMSAMNTAFRRGLIERNPAATVELPRAPHARVDTWSAAELARFLNAIGDERLHLLYRLLGLVGLRRGETVALHWNRRGPQRRTVALPADIATMTHLSGTGTPMRWTVINDKQAICRDDQHAVMGIFAPGYNMHQYREWLVSTVADVLDDDLAISSAGLLRGGAVAWVEVSVPESITTPEGVEFRPNLLATTSFDGSIATTFKRTITDVICDNTRESALAETGQTYKVKHSRHSHTQLAPAREALAVVHTLADDFAREVADLCATTVTEQQWGRLRDADVSRVERQRDARPEDEHADHREGPSTMPAVTPPLGTANRKSATLRTSEIASTTSHSTSCKDPSSL